MELRIQRRNSKASFGSEAHVGIQEGGQGSPEPPATQVWPCLLHSASAGVGGVVWPVARATNSIAMVAFVAVNNGLTGLLGRSAQEPRGRYADPEAGGYPALYPPGDPRSGLPGTSLQVSTALCQQGPSGLWLGLRVSLITQKALVLHLQLSAPCVSSHPPVPGYPPHRRS